MWKPDLRSIIQRQPSLRILTLLTAILFLIGGCKRVDNEQPNNMRDAENVQTFSEQASAQIIMKDSRPVIACYGDSLTAGYGLDADATYPTNLQHLLDDSGYHYRVVNLGISGDTTKDGLARIDRVLALHPAIAVVEFGGNDGLRGIPIANSRENLDFILAKLTHGDMKVALAGITLPPQYGAQYIQQFNETYAILAKKYSVPLLPFVLKDTYGVSGSIQNDGIHPTAQGAQQVAKNIYTLIHPLLKK